MPREHACTSWACWYTREAEKSSSSEESAVPFPLLAPAIWYSYHEVPQMIPTHHRRRQLLNSLPWPLRFLLLPVVKQRGWQAFAGALILLLLVKHKARTIPMLLILPRKHEGLMSRITTLSQCKALCARKSDYKKSLHGGSRSFTVMDLQWDCGDWHMLS